MLTLANAMMARGCGSLDNNNRAPDWIGNGAFIKDYFRADVKIKAGLRGNWLSVLLRGESMCVE